MEIRASSTVESARRAGLLRDAVRWIAVCGVVAMAALSGASGAAADPPMPTVTVHAVRYTFEPAEITLKAGQPVRLVFIADDVAHGIAVPDLGIEAELPKHKAQVFILTPKVAGDFAGECSKYCGTGHNDMRFLVHVQP